MLKCFTLSRSFFRILACSDLPIAWFICLAENDIYTDVSSTARHHFANDCAQWKRLALPITTKGCQNIITLPKIVAKYQPVLITFRSVDLLFFYLFFLWTLMHSDSADVFLFLYYLYLCLLDIRFNYLYIRWVQSRFIVSVFEAH